jgi:DNA-binding XRE family transcriptional regulator
MVRPKVPLKTWDELEKKYFTPRQIAQVRREVDAEVLEMNLAKLRKAAGKTQKEVAKAIDMGQPELSRVERREDHRLSTLRRYVHALGGEIEVIARFGKKKVRLMAV